MTLTDHRKIIIDKALKVKRFSNEKSTWLDNMALFEELLDSKVYSMNNYGEVFLIENDSSPAIARLAEFI